jgi:hypothetical protein
VREADLTTFWEPKPLGQTGILYLFTVQQHVYQVSIFTYSNGKYNAFSPKFKTLYLINMGKILQRSAGKQKTGSVKRFIIHT